ncbi:MAG: transcriptional repressor LexA [Eubacterium sp.]|jgi:repressor LexA|nr:transcriptional repressor LexA [Eubacterium sp.]MCH4078606.1 transcriptional repressor LexA [Eubacterium sp.]
MQGTYSYAKKGGQELKLKSQEYYKTLLSFIDDYREEHGVSPTNRIIASGTGVSTATVSRYLQDLRKEGKIEYKGHRGIITPKMKEEKESTVLVPLLGSIACGIPKYAEGNIEKYIPLPVSLFGKGDFFLLHAKGNSMIDAGINNGDLVLIKKQNAAEPGQIVVALIDEDATLKRFYPEPEKKLIRLHPENKEMNDIYVEHCIIQGIAVNVLKNIN